MSGDELNPERQNAINRSIDACDRQVIDSFARKQTETTTEALVNTFTYFTMDDVKGAETKRMSQEISIGSLNSVKTTKSAENKQKEIKVKVDEDCVKLDEEGIEEEILDDGTKSGVMTTKQSRDVNHKQPQRQFGNYVDDAVSVSDDEGDVDTDGGYSASFCQTEKKAESTERKDISNPEHLRKMENLPHTTERVSECELSALVDSHYEEGEEDGGQLNPGEVEEDIDSLPLSDLERVTCLEITTTRGSSRETTVQDGSSNSDMNKVETDEVETFKLDEDFDYDNVKLTPKFTQEELEYLKTFIPLDSNPT